MNPAQLVAFPQLMVTAFSQMQTVVNPLDLSKS